MIAAVSLSDGRNLDHYPVVLSQSLLEVAG